MFQTFREYKRVPNMVLVNALCVLNPRRHHLVWEYTLVGEDTMEYTYHYDGKRIVYLTECDCWTSRLKEEERMKDFYA